MTSVIRWAWQRFMRPTRFVGRDLEGNKYYEYPNANDGRPKRIVQYKRKDDMWTYIASDRRLPVQWTAWLTHTRLTAPTIEELQADLARRHRVQMNAAILEARDKEERERMAQPTPPFRVPGPSKKKMSERGQREPSTRKSDGPSPAKDPWAINRGSEEPEPWRPVVGRK